MAIYGPPCEIYNTAIIAYIKATLEVGRTIRKPNNNHKPKHVYGICIYVYIYMDMYINTYTYIHTYIYIYMNISIYTDIYKYTQT